MKKEKHFSLFFLLLLLNVILIMFSSSSVEARKDHKKHQQQKKGCGNNQTVAGPVHSPVPSPASSPSYGPHPTQSTKFFDILSFGAKADGISDDSKAFEAAWKAGCRVPGATVKIPPKLRFLVKPLTLQGPCMPHLVLQIDGTLLAPPKVGAWPKSSLFQWINFKWVHNFTIQGTGTVDGQGSAWWNPSAINYVQKKFKHIPDLKPTALRFYASYDVTVRDITIINSPGCHLKFDSSGGVKVGNVTISSPGDSPNTDGIHLQNTHDVEIKDSNIGCGDDCVSIQTGSSNVHVHHVNCSPGNGISLGGLGRDKAVACVSGIIIEYINIQNALSGVRIKTWQGGMGSVKNVSFSNIQVVDVEVPIMIDQYYCDKMKSCKNHTEAVAITGVQYNQITGTYSVQPIHLACSKTVPCINVDLIDIQLKPSSSSSGIKQGLCLNSYGKSQAPLVPSTMDYCLRRGGSWAKQPARSHEHSC